MLEAPLKVSLNRAPTRQAAGGSSRFDGGAKLLAPFRGRALVVWVVDAALAAGLGETIVVVGDTPLDAVLPAGVIVVRNAD